jgi:hypothetical protein
VIRLKGTFAGERAALIFGGPSLIEQGFDFSRLARTGFVTFVEAKALTPRLIEHGFEPDYILLPFPEKAKDNALQNFVFRGLLAGVRAGPLLKRRWRHVADDLTRHFDRYYETWRPHKGPHKRFRLRPGVYLPESPFELLQKLDRIRLIVHGRRFAEQFPGRVPGERAYYFDTLEPAGDFSLDRYYEIEERTGVATLPQFAGQLNSAAIAFYPLLHYMGFREVYCIGMDMSMLGSMEYAAPYTFRSMLAFRWFFWRTRHVFNADFRPNRPYYYRPASEFEDLRRLVKGSNLRIVRVYGPSKYAAPVSDFPVISPAGFLSSLAADSRCQRGADSPFETR